MSDGDSARSYRRGGSGDGVGDHRRARTSRLELLVDLAIAYRWIIAGVAVVSTVAIAVLGVDIAGAIDSLVDAVPDPLWRLLWWSAFAAPFAAISGYLTWRWMAGREELLVLEHFPHGDDHGILWVGEERLRDATVINMRGEEVPTSELKDCYVNGRKAIECLSYVPETNVFVTTWMGGVGVDELRSYRMAIEVAIGNLVEQADAGIKERIAVGPAAMEAGRDVVRFLVDGYEETALPDDVSPSKNVQEAIEDFDLSNPMDGVADTDSSLTDRHGRLKVNGSNVDDVIEEVGDDVE